MGALLHVPRVLDTGQGADQGPVDDAEEGEEAVAGVRDHQPRPVPAEPQAHGHAQLPPAATATATTTQSGANDRTRTRPVGTAALKHVHHTVVPIPPGADSRVATVRSHAPGPDDGSLRGHVPHVHPGNHVNDVHRIVAGIGDKERAAGWGHCSRPGSLHERQPSRVAVGVIKCEMHATGGPKSCNQLQPASDGGGSANQ